jgi:hypothetical protein
MLMRADTQEQSWVKDQLLANRDERRLIKAHESRPPGNSLVKIKRCSKRSREQREMRKAESRPPGQPDEKEPAMGRQKQKTENGHMLMRQTLLEQPGEEPAL